MKALVYTGIESLNYQTVTDPNPKPGEVLDLIVQDYYHMCRHLWL